MSNGEARHPAPTADVVPVATRYEFRPPEVFVGAAMDHARLYDWRAITVAWRGGSTWAIQLGDSSPCRVWCEKTREWEWEPQPSSRGTAFLRRTRYPLDQALAIGARLVKEKP